MNATVKLSGLDPALLIALIDKQMKVEPEQNMINLMLKIKEKIKLGIYSDAVAPFIAGEKE